jgi:hypothetical protein
MAMARHIITTRISPFDRSVAPLDLVPGCNPSTCIKNKGYALMYSGGLKPR